ncbi:MAG: carbohydrate kinase [Lautropia sp.]|nr:carbohydrate kinase [Lautropia sp.]
MLQSCAPEAALDAQEPLDSPDASPRQGKHTIMKVTSFGEVLWDDLPTGKLLGGAPLNVLVRLRSLGSECSIISARGNDANGTELLSQIEARDVDTSLLQVCPDQPTSLVKVTLNQQGSASYDIVYPCAWDRIQVDPAALQRVRESDAFLFGSLCTRDEVSRKTLEQLLPAARFRVFDVNLRKPHYKPERVLELMKQAHLVKLNDDELYELASFAGSKYRGTDQNIRFLTEYTGVRQICVTLGSHGAVYVDHGKFYYSTGYRIDVVDTIGAGDSFLAGLLYKLLNRIPPQESLNFACALGAMVASRRGPTPEISAREIDQFMHPV